LNPVLVVLLAVLGVPLFVLIRIINDVTKNYSINKTARTAGLQKILIQSLHNYKYLKATAEYPSILGHVAAESRALGMIEFKEKRLAAFAEFGFEPFIILIVAGVIFYNVEIRGQDLLRNLFLLYLLYNALKRILAIQSRYRKLLNAWGSIGVVNVLESETERHREETRRAPGISAVPFDCPIVFENVVFSFNGGAPVLKNLSIEIPPNTTVAIVGESGGGKTTLVNLLVGLLRPTSGVIRIGDVSYSELDRHEFRKKIGYITQETALFNDTIRNNITLWGDARSGSDENVRAAAARAHIDDFIEGLESGYDTVLGEGGITVSGGQRQRLCIARELYKDARLLIFDEATSSLDSATEKEIQKNIDELRGEKTVVLVAHRLSTVRNADRIFCLKDGTVVEAGTYAELYAAGGEFRRMVDQQNA